LPPSVALTVARTANLDLQWRQAVCRYLSVQVDQRRVTAQTLAGLMPVLQALYPNQTPLNWTGLMTILQEMVDVFRQLKVEKDIYAPYFPTKGSQRTYCFEVVRGNQAGVVFACTFPGLTKRAWDEQRQGWYVTLLTPAVVELESALVG
jgi:hypothetical protein